MSAGTADQLYLALRVAAIEDYLDHAEPMPFIADDLFINFDDKRAAAGFRVLNELAKKTQVLFFTHHEHLLDVARNTLGTLVPTVVLPAVIGRRRPIPCEQKRPRGACALRLATRRIWLEPSVWISDTFFCHSIYLIVYKRLIEPRAAPEGSRLRKPRIDARAKVAEHSVNARGLGRRFRNFRAAVASYLRPPSGSRGNHMKTGAKQTEEPPPPSDLQGWKDVAAADGLRRLRPEDIVAVLQRIGPSSDQRLLSALVSHVSDELLRIIKRLVGKNNRNEGEDIIWRAHHQLIVGALTPNSETGQGLCNNFRTWVEYRVADAIRAERRYAHRNQSVRNQDDGQ